MWEDQIKLICSKRLVWSNVSGSRKSKMIFFRRICFKIPTDHENCPIINYLQLSCWLLVFLLISCILAAGSTKENITIRTCTVDSGSKTSDVELIRIPHSCGQTAFLNDGSIGRSKKDIDDEDILKDSDLRIYACINVCNDYGCNHSSNLIHFNLLLLIIVLICILFWKDTQNCFLNVEFLIIIMPREMPFYVCVRIWLFFMHNTHVKEINPACSDNCLGGSRSKVNKIELCKWSKTLGWIMP